MTPYRKAVNFKITDEVVYLTADEEQDYIISQSTVNTNEENVIIDKTVAARFRDENILAKPEQVEYIDVATQQGVSETTS